MAENTRFAARPTTYKGVEMRSRLEARYAAWLDKAGATWTYEPCAFADGASQYLPDFRVDHVQLFARDHTVYVEVKPTAEQALDAIDGMTPIWASEPDAILVVEAGCQSWNGMCAGLIGGNVRMWPLAWCRSEGGLALVPIAPGHRGWWTY